MSNHSGRLAGGTHLADALHAWPDAELRVLFGMEFDTRLLSPRSASTAVRSVTSPPSAVRPARVASDTAPSARAHCSSARSFSRK